MATPRLQLTGSTLVVLATAVAGVFGYAIQAVAGRGLAAHDYASFGVFWAAVFLAVGAMSGVQQETARATRPGVGDSAATRRLGSASLVVASVAAAVLVVTSVGWASIVFADDAPGRVWLLAAAVLFSAMAAALAGVLYGLRDWRRVAVVICVDPALRLLLVGLSLASGRTDLLPFAIVAPIVLTVVCAVGLVLPRLRKGVVIDVSTVGQLSLNMARAVVGASATAVLVSALPLFIGAASRGTSASEIGALLFNLTLTRAPIVIPALAFQSLMVVYFRDRLAGVGRAVLIASGVVLAAAVMVAVVCGVVGPEIIAAVFGDDYRLDGLPLAMLVASSGLTAILSVSGAATLALKRHTAFLAGWMVAAAGCVAILFGAPGDLVMRSGLALSLGPLLGIGIHVIAIRRARAAG